MVGTVTHTLNTTIQETQAGEFCESQASQDYMMRLFLKKKKSTFHYYVCLPHSAQRSGDKLQESVSSVHHVGPGTEFR